jgi:hypothetical protein
VQPHTGYETASIQPPGHNRIILLMSYESLC